MKKLSIILLGVISGAGSSNAGEGTESMPQVNENKAARCIVQYWENGKMQWESEELLNTQRPRVQVRDASGLYPYGYVPSPYSESVSEGGW